MRYVGDEIGDLLQPPRPCDEHEEDLVATTHDRHLALMHRVPCRDAIENISVLLRNSKLVDETALSHAATGALSLIHI